MAGSGFSAPARLDTVTFWKNRARPATGSCQKFGENAHRASGAKAAAVSHVSI